MSIETNQVREQLRDFLRDSLGMRLSDDDDIFLVGGASSLFAMELVMFMERKFQITLDDSDLERANFSSIDGMASLIDRKRSV